MSAPLYPPAPWEAIGSMFVRGAFHMGDPDRAGVIICTVGRHLPSEDARRITQAIAALPELAEALQVMLADFGDYPASERPCRAFDLARAALAKAGLA